MRLIGIVGVLHADDLSGDIANYLRRSVDDREQREAAHFLDHFPFTSCGELGQRVSTYLDEVFREYPDGVSAEVYAPVDWLAKNLTATS